MESQYHVLQSSFEETRAPFFNHNTRTHTTRLAASSNPSAVACSRIFSLTF